MHSFIAVAIVALSILSSLHVDGANASTGVEINNLRADATFRGSIILAAPDQLTRPGRNPRTEQDEPLAAIVSARISEPDRVAGVLNVLRVESTGHLGRLDLEEWFEMMAEMRSGGVALGSRNKLRLLVAEQWSGSQDTWSAALLGGQRRVQTESGDAESSSRSGRQAGDSISATKHASEQEPGKESTGKIFGVSGDSAPQIAARLVY
jgi:hypothetical protein